MLLSNQQRSYALDFIRRTLAIPDIPSNTPEELIELVYRELSRQEEKESAARDEWSRWDWPYSAASRNGTLYRPHVDEAILQWGACEGYLSPESRKSCWPDGKPFALCLTHDVDFVSRNSTSPSFVWEMIRRLLHAPHGQELVIASRLFRHALKLIASPLMWQLGADPYHCFDVCIDLEAKRGFTSTFFFFAGHLPTPHALDCGYSHSDRLIFYGSKVTVRQMMREILRRGWDIGLHGSYWAAIDSSALMQEKRQLEESAGKAINSIRHHYLHYDAQVTPAIHQRAGFAADSTQGFNRNIGFRAGTSFPYLCWNEQTHQATDVLEIPMLIMDTSLFSPGALGCDLDLAKSYIRLIMDRVETVGGCLTVNWHPCWLSNALYADSYKFLLDEAKRRNAWGSGINDLLRWQKSFS